MKKKKSNKKKNKKFIISEGFLVLMGISLITGGVILLSKKIVETNNEDKLPKTQLAIKINSYIDFENSKSEGIANIENNKKNSSDIVVKILLKETNEEVYESKKLKPGEKVEEIKLSKKLPKGKYKAIAYFYAYQNDEYLGKSGAMISLNINN